MNCKLTVNGGLGMSGECYYDKVTGKFTDKKLKTACRSGAEKCPHLNLKWFKAEHLEASNKKWAAGCFAGTKGFLLGNLSASKACNKKRVAG